MKLLTMLLIMYALFTTVVFAEEDHSIGVCYHFLKTGDFDKAIEAGYAAIDSSPTVFDSHYCLAEALRLNGEPELALQELQQVEGVANDKFKRRKVQDSLGLIFMSVGETEAAIQIFLQSLELAHETGDPQEEVSALGNLASIYHSVNQTESALEYYGKALPLAKDTIKAPIYNNMAVIYGNRGEYKKAEDCLLKAVALDVKMADYSAQGRHLLNLGGNYLLMRYFEDAQKAFNTSVELSRKAGNIVWEATAYSQIGRLYRNMGNSGAAKLWYDKALHVYSKADMQSDVDNIRAALEELTKPRNYLGIEIHEAGVTSVTLVSLPLLNGEHRFRELARKSIKIPVLANYKANLSFDVVSIDETAKIVKQLCDEASVNFKVDPSSFFIIAGSEFAKAANRDTLAAKIFELTGYALEFVTSDEEVLFNLSGNIPQKTQRKSLLLHIDKDVVKICHFDRPGDKNGVVSVKVPTAIPAKEATAVASCTASFNGKVLVTGLRREMRKHHGYANRRPVYLSGDLVRALVTLLRPGNSDSQIKITTAELDGFITAFKANSAVYFNTEIASISDAIKLAWAKAEVNAVKDHYSKDSLLSAASLMRTVFIEMKINFGYFSRSGSWLAGRINLQERDAHEMVVAAGR